MSGICCRAIGYMQASREASLQAKITDVRPLCTLKPLIGGQTETHLCAVNVKASLVLSKGSWGTMSEVGTRQVVRVNVLFSLKGEGIQKLGVIITRLLTETQDTISRMLR